MSLLYANASFAEAVTQWMLARWRPNTTFLHTMRYGDAANMRVSLLGDTTGEGEISSRPFACERQASIPATRCIWPRRCRRCGRYRIRYEVDSRVVGTCCGLKLSVQHYEAVMTDLAADIEASRPAQTTAIVPYQQKAIVPVTGPRSASIVVTSAPVASIVARAEKHAAYTHNEPT